MENINGFFELSERIKIARAEKNIGIKYLSTKIIDRLSEPDVNVY